jgi:hypothetical protein
MVFAFLTFCLKVYSQVRNGKDSLNQRNKTDSIDFRSNPSRSQKKIPGDSIKWNARDSFQIDDKNPKRFPKHVRDTIH